MLLAAPAWAGTVKYVDRVDTTAIDNTYVDEFGQRSEWIWVRQYDIHEGAEPTAFNNNADLVYLHYINWGFAPRSCYNTAAGNGKYIACMVNQGGNEDWWMHDVDGLRISTENTEVASNCNTQTAGTGTAMPGPCATMRAKTGWGMMPADAGTTTASYCEIGVGGCVQQKICKSDGLTYCQTKTDCPDDPGSWEDCVAGFGVINDSMCVGCQFTMDLGHPGFRAFIAEALVDGVNGNKEGASIGDLSAWRAVEYYGFCEWNDDQTGYCISGPSAGSACPGGNGDCTDDAACPGGVCRCSNTNTGEYPHNKDAAHGVLCNQDNTCQGGTNDGTLCDRDNICTGGGVCQSSDCGTGLMCQGLGGYEEIPIGGAGADVSPVRSVESMGYYHDNMGAIDSVVDPTWTCADPNQASDCAWNMGYALRTDFNGAGTGYCTDDTDCPGSTACCDDPGVTDANCTMMKFCLDEDANRACDRTCYGTHDADQVGISRAVYMEEATAAIKAYDSNKYFVFNGCGASSSNEIAIADRWISGTETGQVGTGIDGCSAEQMFVFGTGALRTTADVTTNLEAAQRLTMQGYWLPLAMGNETRKSATNDAWDNPTYAHSRMRDYGEAGVLLGCSYKDTRYCMFSGWGSQYASIAERAAFTTEFPSYDDLLGYPESGYRKVCSVDTRISCWDNDDCTNFGGGTCTSQNYTVSGDLFVRKFTGGRVILCGDGGACTWTIDGTASDWLLPDGTQMTSITSNVNSVEFNCSNDINAETTLCGECSGGSNPGDPCAVPATCTGGGTCVGTVEANCDAYGDSGCVNPSRAYVTGGTTLNIPSRHAVVLHYNTANQDFCGDGTVDVGEECDSGANNNNNLADACRLDCTNAGCGDWVIDTGEACDDGNITGGDGCSATCQLEGDLQGVTLNGVSIN